VTHLACYAYGAGHADEGVCLQLEIDNYRILLDCGLKNWHPDADFKGRSDWDNLIDRAASIDLIICSHAHPEQAEGLLALHQQFPHIPIYTSAVTAQLLPLNWPGAIVPETLCTALPWRSPSELLDRLTVELIPAGHLPGAATILLTYQAPQRLVRVVYSGDFCLSNTRFAEGLRLVELRGLMPDALIVAGTDGTRRHPHRRQQENRLIERLAQALSVGESILLPVPTIGLGQELLLLLRSHYLFSGRDLTIWVDGCVAAGCDAYLDVIDQFPIAVQNFAQNQALFWDDQVQPRVQLGRPAPDHTAPCIVLTDQPIAVSQFCDRGQWLVLLPETITAGSLGPIAAVSPAGRSQALVTAETYWLSDQSDGNATLQLIHNLRPQHVLFVHGTLESLTEFAVLDELNSRYKLHLPRSGSWVELPIAEPPIGLSSTLPETRYEGEVVETAADILISLPTEFTTDSRWAGFADTGIVEAYWQDDRLVLRGMTPAEITGNRLPSSVQERNCLNCQCYQNQRCTNPASALFQLQVTADGDCLEFRSASTSRSAD
jgi:Cft2 family RNA processing exonuclease